MVRGAGNANEPMRRGDDGQLWVDPAKLARKLEDGSVVIGVTLETFEVFEYAGRLYEVWGRRSDGMLWVGLVKTPTARRFVEAS